MAAGLLQRATQPPGAPGPATSGTSELACQEPVERSRPSACCLGQGLGTTNLNDSSITELVKLIKRYEDSHDLKTIVRFAHEMNGVW